MFFFFVSAAAAGNFRHPTLAVVLTMSIYASAYISMSIKQFYKIKTPKCSSWEACRSMVAPKLFWGNVLPAMRVATIAARFIVADPRRNLRCQMQVPRFAIHTSALTIRGQIGPLFKMLKCECSLSGCRSDCCLEL